MPLQHTAASAAAPLTRAQAHAWAQVGVLSALALALGYVETFIPLPVPVPGVKLGLANIAVLVALAMLDTHRAALVALAKVLAAGFLFGNPLMMAYSAAGTTLAFAAMAAVLRVPEATAMLAAVAGAILHNVGQLAMAGVFLGTPAVWAALPPLVLAAVATGLLNGTAAQTTLACLQAMPAMPGAKSQAGAAARTASREGATMPTATARAQGGSGKNAPHPPSSTANTRLHSAAKAGRRRLDARVKALALAAYVIAALHASSPLALATCAAAALATLICTHLTWRDVSAAMAPLAAILLFTAGFQVLHLQQGALLFTVGPVAVTREALASAGRMVLVLSCLLATSIAFMRCTPTGDLVGMLRHLLAPLRKRGVRTEGFLFALQTAFTFAPLLVGDFLQLKRSQEARAGSFSGSVRQRLGAYARLFAPLTRSAFLRAGRLADAAVARGLGCGVAPSALDTARLEPRDYMFLATALALAIFLFLV